MLKLRSFFLDVSGCKSLKEFAEVKPFSYFWCPYFTDLPAPYLICLLLTCWSILKLHISSSIYMYLFIILCDFIVLMLYIKGYGNTKDIAMNNNLSLKSTN